MSKFIEQLLTQPEGKTLEFKRSLSSPKPLIKTLLSFANTAGGRLIIGVADDCNIVGVADPLNEEERLANLIADSIVPRLVPNIEMLTVDNKNIAHCGSLPQWPSAPSFQGRRYGKRCLCQAWFKQPSGRYTIDR